MLQGTEPVFSSDFKIGKGVQPEHLVALRYQGETLTKGIEIPYVTER